jgi:hypothetical protein
MTLNIKGLFRTLSIHDTQYNDTQHNYIHHNDTQHNGFVCDTQHKQHTAYMSLSITAICIEFHYAVVTLSVSFFILILSVETLSVIMQSVIVLSIIMLRLIVLSVIMLSVVAPKAALVIEFCSYHNIV